ncbi:SARP family transcriptional regulator [Longispora fulva]|uniref:DNA-binding SARP family transcriptional activator n=1 Tax=Longispora fulva TaxID=619741 RepID=A0A8J7KXF6_9ACTN|nr:BTAD domain-containing putative transcriptional regulator [Longispora fulva]MBG6137762.1 DNA-binding SARP family transcriptional activator [Longispora fulva]GIG62081.1 SARP family transcriptional regulator [Longispora fulva]
MDVRFGILGPVEVSVAGQVLPTMAPRHRAVLSYLVLHAGEVVSTDRLIDAIWGNDPPETCRGQIQVSISAIRKRLSAAGATDVVRTRSAGYVIPRQHQIDAALFADRASDATGPDQLREALALWRGPALADVRAGYVDAARVRWDELRLAAFERLAELELERGRHAEMVDELSRLLDAHPLRERLIELRMLALYRAGQRQAALSAFAGARRRLIEETGLDPRPELVALHDRMLAADPTLDRTGPARPVPAQLPATGSDFTGRADELRALDLLLPEHGAGDPVVISAIDGRGGVGKTALAVHWAHRVRDLFPDGQLYVNLHGYSTVPAVRPVDVLARFLRALGTAPDQIPAGLEEASALYRSLLADARVLVLLDNAHHADQVRPLLPGGAGSLALVTSRDRLTSLTALDGARRLALDVLSPAEGLALLGRIIGAHRVAAEPGPAAELVALCGHLPLAVRIAAAHLADQPDRALAAHNASLRHGDRLTGLEIPGEDRASIRAVFSWSYTALEPGAARLFRLLGLVPGPDFTVAAVAALAGLAAADAARLLDRLVAAHLVDELADGRYTLHDLVRIFAAERAHAEEPAAARDTATEHLHDWYVRIADHAGNRLYPQARRLPVPHPAGEADNPFPDNAAALAALDAELPNLIAATRRGPDRAVWRITDALRGYIWLRKSAADWVSVATTAVTAADRSGDTLARAAAQFALGVALAAASDPTTAHGHFARAARLSARCGWRDGQIAALSSCGATSVEAGQLGRGADHYREVLALEDPARLTGDLLANVGSLFNHLGRLDEAADLLRAGAVPDRPGDGPGALAACTIVLGITTYRRGRYDEAGDLFTDGLALAEKLGYASLEVTALTFLSQISADRGEWAAALRDAEKALALVRRGALRHQVSSVLAALGAVHHHLGDHDLALEHYAAAMDSATDVSSRLGQAGAHLGLAAVHTALGQGGRAVEHGRRALELTEPEGYRFLIAGAHTTLACAHLALGDRVAALAHATSALEIAEEVGHPLGAARAHLILSELDGGDHRAAAHAILRPLRIPDTVAV